jgi:hypothetical protein
MKNVNPDTIYGAWYYIYGKGSHMNLAGKLILGIPLFPVVAVAVGTLLICDKLFTRKQA